MRKIVISIFALLGLLFSLNLEESFSSRRFPPLGWRVINNDGGAHTWSRDSVNYRSIPGATSSRYESNTLRNNDWLITSRLVCRVGIPDTLKFWYKKTSGGNPDSLEVWLSTTGNDISNFSVLLRARKITNTSYQQEVIPLDNFDGQEIYIAFVNKALYGTRICLDDISGPELIEIRDIGVDSVIAPTLYVLRPISGGFLPQTLIRNYSNGPQYNIPVVCSIFSNTTLIYFSYKSIDSLKLDSSIAVNFDTFFPSTAGQFLIKVTVNQVGDSNATNNSKMQTTEVISGQYTGGPDGGYYFWIDSDTVSGPIYNWYDISLDGLQLPTGDAMVAGPISIGFPFNFYGELKEEFWYSTNGFITFDEIALSHNTNTVIPNGNFPNSVLAPFWDDLYTYEARYKRIGTFPNRNLVVQWKACAYRQGAFQDTVIFQIILHENGEIIYQYKTINNQLIARGESATVGIEDPTGSTGLLYLYNGTPRGNLLSACRAIRFYRNCHDVSLDSILISEVAVNESVFPTVQVKNLGTYEETFKVKFVIYENQNALYEDSSWVYGLLPAETQSISFRAWASSQIGTYVQKAWVVLPEDINSQNDTSYQTLDVTFPAPMLLCPQNGLVTNANNIFFDWTNVSNATRYNIVINNLDTVSSVSQLGPVSLAEGSYIWRVRAGNLVKWGRWSAPYYFYVDRTPPTPPVPLAPANNCTLNISRPTFIWSQKPEAQSYELVIYNLSGTILSQILSDTVYHFTERLSNGRYYWKLRAQDLAGNWSAYSSAFTFYINVVFWHQTNNIPLLPSNKPVADGGALTALGSKIYALKGNNTQDFYVYDIELSKGWDLLSQVPHLPDGPKKNIKAGGAITGGDNKIYLIKGNLSREFWEYDTDNDTWIRRPEVPSIRSLRAGSALAYHDGIVYLLIGSDNRFEFYRYVVNQHSWDTLASAPAGPNSRIFRAGSAITYANAGKVYALKGNKENEFYVYEIATNQWVAKQNLPLVHPQVRKRKHVRVGGALAYDGSNFIYALKGGRCNEFWCYDILNDSWLPKETIPRLHKTKSYVGAGAGLVVAQGKIWLLKGNKTLEFWQYEDNKALAPTDIKTPADFTNNKAYNCPDKSILPIRKLIIYGNNQSSVNSMKIYNPCGQLIKAKNPDVQNFTLSKGIYFIIAE
ncbi:MAG: choice-of-anchor J domain-containing protein [candidate division WOR-3 bacterium]